MEPPGAESSFAERLKWLREHKLRVSARDFARGLQSYEGLEKVTHKRVGDYESGRVPSADYLAAAAREAGIDPAWLLTGQGRPDRKPADVSQRAFEEIAEVVDRYRAAPLSAEDAGEVVRQAEEANALAAESPPARETRKGPSAGRANAPRRVKGRGDA